MAAPGLSLAAAALTFVSMKTSPKIAPALALRLAISEGAVKDHRNKAWPRLAISSQTGLFLRFRATL